MALTLAIVGRPNVGKSTLFNRLTGRRAALVDETPGVTRDRRAGKGRLGDLDFTAIDTAGLEEAPPDSLEARMRAQTERAVAEADLVLFLVDARAGITPLDRHFAAWLRRSRKPIVLVANKCEGRAGAEGALAAFELGLGEPIAVSAEHGEGLSDLYAAILAHQSTAPPAAAPAPEGEAERIELAIVGRPNVGKSTLINRLIGEERLLTGPEAGITRDAIAIDWRHRGRPFRLVDTAGLRRRARVVDRLEQLSGADALRSIRFAPVVVLVLDALDMLERQDLAIARLADRLETSLPQAKGVPAVAVSALTGRNLDKLLDAVEDAYAVWNRRVATADLNRWLEEAVAAHPPPLVEGRRLKLRYATQVKTRPPTFVLFASRPEKLPDSYARYLVNDLRARFDLPGVPIRLELRKGRNPYAREG